MPRFYDRPAITVGGAREYYELDGELLRAVMIATHDFLPARTRHLPCGSRLEAQRYLVNRQGNVIFVYIYEDPEYCGGGYVALDSGAKYAISTDGRILRRVFDGESEEPFEGVYPDGGPIGNTPSQPSRESQDGGSPPEWSDGGPGSLRSMPEPGPSAVPDGGSPLE